MGPPAPTEAQLDAARGALVAAVAPRLTGGLIELLDTIRRDAEQTVDHDTLDTLLLAEGAGGADSNARAVAAEFEEWLRAHRDEIDALAIWFGEPARRAEVTDAMVKALLAAIRADRPRLAPAHVWRAYAHLDGYRGEAPTGDLTQLVALARRVAGLDASLIAQEERVRRNFQRWVMERHQGAGERFTDEPMVWLRMIRDHVATSLRLERDDFDFAPFDSAGGLGSGLTTAARR